MWWPEPQVVIGQLHSCERTELRKEAKTSLQAAHSLRDTSQFQKH